MKLNVLLIGLLGTLIAVYIATQPRPEPTGIPQARAALVERDLAERMRGSIRIVVRPGQEQIEVARQRTTLPKDDLDFLRTHEVPHEVRVERQVTPRGAGRYSGWMARSHNGHPVLTRAIDDLQRSLRRLRRGSAVIEAQGEINESLLQQYGLDEANALVVELYTARQESRVNAEGQQVVQFVPEPLFGIRIGHAPARTIEARRGRSFSADRVEPRFVRIARLEPGSGRQPGRFVYDTDIRLIDNVPAEIEELAHIDRWIDLGVTKIGDQRLRPDDIYRIEFSGTAIERPYALQRLGGDEATADRLWSELSRLATEEEVVEFMSRQRTWFFAQAGRQLLGEPGEQADDGQWRAAITDFSSYEAAGLYGANEASLPSDPYLRIRIYPVQELLKINRIEELLNARELWGTLIDRIDRASMTEDVEIPVRLLHETARQRRMRDDAVVNFLLRNLQPGLVEPVFADGEIAEEEFADGIPATVTLPYGAEDRTVRAVRFVLAGNDPFAISRQIQESLEDVVANATQVVRLYETSAALRRFTADVLRAPSGTDEHAQRQQLVETVTRRVRDELRQLRRHDIPDPDIQETRDQRMVAAAQAAAGAEASMRLAQAIFERDLWNLLFRHTRETGSTRIMVADLLAQARAMGIGRESVGDFALGFWARRITPLAAEEFDEVDEFEEADWFDERTVRGERVRVVGFDVSLAAQGPDALRATFRNTLATLLPSLMTPEMERAIRQRDDQAIVAAHVAAVDELWVMLDELIDLERTLALDPTADEADQRREALRTTLSEWLSEQGERVLSLAEAIGATRAAAAQEAAAEHGDDDDTNGDTPTAWVDAYERYRDARDDADGRFWRLFYDVFAMPMELIVVEDRDAAESDEGEANGVTYRVTSSRLRPIPHGFWYRMTRDVAERWAYSREYFERFDPYADDGDSPDEPSPQTQPGAADDVSDEDVSEDRADDADDPAAAESGDDNSAETTGDNGADDRNE